MKLSLTLPGDYRVDPIRDMPSGGIDKAETILSAGVQLLFVVLVIGALLFMIWGGIQWITSGGDKSGVEAARKKIVYAVIGLVVAFLAYFIIAFIGNFFGVKLLDLPT